jgi:hypothetical protein
MTVSNVTGTFVCKNNGTTSTCKYSATSALAKVEGSDTAPKIIASGILLTKENGGFFVCGEAGDWSGTYNISNPTSLFIE